MTAPRSARPTPELAVVDDVAAAALDLFVREQPRTVVLSGGNTPKTFYELLSRSNYPWEEVEFFFGDDRCVPADDPRSNARMASETLLSKIPAKAYPIDGSACDADGYERMLRERFGGAPRFDFAVYGIGSDGHTASLFPGHPEAAETERWVVNVPMSGLEPFVPRISMTARALSATRLGVFLIEGSSKREPLRRLLAGDDIPACTMAPQRLVILADRAAAP